DRQPKIWWIDRQQRRRCAIHTQTEECRVAEGDHAGVTDQDVRRHSEQAPDEDLRQEASPEFRQHERRYCEQHQNDAASDPVGLAWSLFHFGVGTKRPVGRINSVKIRTTNETITAWAGLTQIEA